MPGCRRTPARRSRRTARTRSPRAPPPRRRPGPGASSGLPRGSTGSPALRSWSRSTAAPSKSSCPPSPGPPAAARRASGCRVAARGGREPGEQFGAQERSEVAREEESEQLPGDECEPRVPAGAVDHAPAQRRAFHAREDPREVGYGVGGDVCAGSPGAELAQDAGDRRERRAIERVGPVRRHHRVEHQRFDMAGVGLRVLLGDLRAVGGAVQDELFVASRLPDSLDVRDRVGGRVVGPRSSQLVGARFDLRTYRVVQVGGFEGVAGQRMRTGRCRAGRRRSDRASRRSGRAVRRIPPRTEAPAARAPRERDDRAVRVAHRRKMAAQRERDRARRRAAAVQRHRQVAAGEVVAVAARCKRDLGAARTPARTPTRKPPGALPRARAPTVA